LQKVFYDRPGGKVLYHTASNPCFEHSTTLWNAADFIAALTQFIPWAAAGCAAVGESPALGCAIRALLRALLLPMQGVSAPECSPPNGGDFRNRLSYHSSEVPILLEDQRRPGDPPFALAAGGQCTNEWLFVAPDSHTGIPRALP
jgi:hypothetical protein